MRRSWSLVLLPFVALVLAACSSLPFVSRESGQQALPAEGGTVAGREGSGIAIAPSGMPAIGDQSRAAQATAPSTGSAPAPSDPNAPAANVLDRKLVYNAELSMEVRDVQDSLEAVAAIARNAGGFVANSNMRYEGERRVGVITIRVPAERFDAIMAELRRLGLNVTSETSNVRDVTEEYTDLEARLRNLRATEAQYLQLLQQARSIQDIITIQDRLNQVRLQIEQTQARINLLDRTSELATITVRLLPPAVAPSETGWNPGRVLREAWERAVVFLQVAASVAIYALVFVWLWVPALVLIVWAVRRWLRRPSPLPGTTTV